MNLAILGPQASGKGTQAQLLAKKTGLFLLEMGDVCRDLAAQKTTLGQKVASFINQGRLVPDRMMIKILKNFLNPKNLKKGILFDGFPRKLGQVKILENELKRWQSQIDKVIFLNLSLEESRRRLSARRVCPRCGRNYNLITRPPKKKGICDQCGVALIIRADETDEAIKRRLALYQQETLPVIEYYRDKGILLEINGDQPVEVIQQEILESLKLSFAF
ncbi:nucleoside monophosphate kinase [Candidatus Shapirobacteria bacterium]|nr:nucleoside monophosphate kinase [Candidatus Shapirobacteria bacterium]